MQREAGHVGERGSLPAGKERPLGDSAERAVAAMTRRPRFFLFRVGVGADIHEGLAVSVYGAEQERADVDDADYKRAD